jgi:hypothetical protein
MADDTFKSKDRYPKWIFIPLFLAPVILFLPVLLPGKSLFWGITSLQFIPWHWAALNDIQQGILPLWNPLNGLGAPLAANYQSALFYPPTWLVLIAGWVGGITWLAWAHGLLIVLHLMWAGWGMKSLTAYLGVSQIPQLICGLAYGLCGYMVARGGFLTMVQAASWIPWILLAASQIACPIKITPPNGIKPQIRSVVWLSLAFSGQWLSGHAQLAWYTILFCCAWLFYGGLLNGGLKTLIKTIGLTLVAGIIAFLVSSIQLIPTIEYFIQSQRSSAIDFQTALSYSFWPWRLITFLSPNFFGNPGLGNYWGYANYWEDAIYLGILPLFFAIYFLFQHEKNIEEKYWGKIKPVRRFAIISIGITFLLALGWNTPVFPWLFQNIPTFGIFNGPTRWMIIVEVCLILLAGFGAESWIQRGILHGKLINLSLTAVIAAMAGAIGVGFFFKEINQSFVFSIISTGIFLSGYLILAKFKPETSRLNLWRIVIVGWFTLDLLWAGLFLNPAIDTRLYEIEESPNSLTSRKHADIYYWDSLQENAQRFNRFFQFKDIRATEDIYNLLATYLPNTNMISNVATLNNFDPIVPARYTDFMMELNNSSEVERNRYLSLASVDEISSVAPTNIHEISWIRINTLPEVRLVPCSEFTKTPDNALNWLRKAIQENNFETRIILESDEKPKEACKLNLTTDTSTLITSNLDNGLVIDINGNSLNQWLFVARSWYPGWEARVDGIKSEILRADYMFMAIKVSPGNHRIELTYSPLSFQIGRYLSIFGLLFLIITGFFLNKKGEVSLES